MLVVRSHAITQRNLCVVSISGERLARAIISIECRNVSVSVHVLESYLASSLLSHTVPSPKLPRMIPHVNIMSCHWYRITIERMYVVVGKAVDSVSKIFIAIKSDTQTYSIYNSLYLLTDEISRD